MVEGTIFAFGFSKKYDLSLLLIEGQVLSVSGIRPTCQYDSHLCAQLKKGRKTEPGKSVAKIGTDLPEKAEKGPNFKTALLR